MKILIVGSVNRRHGHYAPYIIEQGDRLRLLDNVIEYFPIDKPGVFGYIRAIMPLRKVIKQKNPDVVHAHYGFCGLIACLQRLVPVIVTFHGSDVNNPFNRILSTITAWLSSWNICVSHKLVKKLKLKKKYSVIPCGVNIPNDIFNTVKIESILEPSVKHVLFAGAFDNEIKDYPLALNTIDILQNNIKNNVQLIELKGYSREEVYELMIKCDVLLMTSKSEGSPQVVKEAMVCGLPIVSVDVGDVRERLTISLSDTNTVTNTVTNTKPDTILHGCYVADSRNPEEIAELLKKALAFGKRTGGRKLIVEAGLRNDQIAQKLVESYKSVSCRG